jgi:hypothetical protein
MKGSFGKLLKIAFIGTIGYIGFKVYKKIRAAIDLDKTLPQYLENVIGEKPEVNITYTLNEYTVSVCFSKEILEKNKDLETTVRDYICDFYPILNIEKIKIELNQREEKEKAE